MLPNPQANDHLHRLIWSQAAHHILTTLSTPGDVELIAVGCGWGLRDPEDHNRAVLVYPSNRQRALGDLTVVIPHTAPHTVPRYGREYGPYVRDVQDVVETLLHNLHRAPDTAATPGDNS